MGRLVSESGQEVALAPITSIIARAHHALCAMDQLGVDRVAHFADHSTRNDTCQYPIAASDAESIKIKVTSFLLRRFPAIDPEYIARLVKESVARRVALSSARDEAVEFGTKSQREEYHVRY